jgi:hypothetical protein
MTREHFIGAWKLVSAQYRRANGEILEMYGDHPIGVLMYAADGNMSVHIMRRDRPKFAVADRLGGTPEQILAAFQGYLAYFGTYTVDEEKRAVTHHIVGCLLPNWVGVDQVRFFEFNDNRLTLRTPPLMIGGAEAVGHIVWERAR